MTTKTIPAIVLAAALSACAERPHDTTETDAPPPIYPEYTDIAIPCNIAPLNFLVRGEVEAAEVRIVGKHDSIVVNTGHKVVIAPGRWRSLLEKEKGDTLTVTLTVKEDGAWTRYASTGWYVAPDSIDRYMSYRLIEPGYEVWNHITLCERDLESFDERVLCDNAENDRACMNCHIYSKTRPMSIFHLRGKGGGTMIARDGKITCQPLRHDSLASAAVYGDIHPSGRYGVFSTNVIIPAFHTYGSNRLEVFDKESDLVVADFETGEMILSPEVARKDRMETFPTFSADGGSVYFCTADTFAFDGDLSRVRYSLCRVAFDASTGKLNGKIDTLWNAGATGASACHPKASPDGKFLLFTEAAYGTFPIWHRETDLRMLRLDTGEVDSLGAVNSDRSDTYHSWSGNSRWIVFASKRGDGQYGRPYIAYIDVQGRAYRPFAVPQENPEFYDDCLKSFNIPDLSPYPSGFSNFTLEDLDGRR